MNKDIESILRAQRWRDPPPEFFEHLLEKAIGATRSEGDMPKRRMHVIAWLSYIPRPLRLPLAACWLLALFFHVTTPEAIPQSTLNSYAKLPPMTPVQLLANLKQIEQLADELLHPQHQGPIPPL